MLLAVISILLIVGQSAMAKKKKKSVMYIKSLQVSTRNLC